MQIAEAFLLADISPFYDNLREGSMAVSQKNRPNFVLRATARKGAKMERVVFRRKIVTFARIGHEK